MKEQIARLDENGILVSIETPAHEDDCETCHVAKTVKLPKNHDMHSKKGQYYFDFAQGCFLPIEEEEFIPEKKLTRNSKFAKAVVTVLQLLIDNPNVRIEVPIETRKALGL